MRSAAGGILRLIMRSVLSPQPDGPTSTTNSLSDVEIDARTASTSSKRDDLAQHDVTITFALRLLSPLHDQSRKTIATNPL
jgi:hypothetical protein